MTRKPKATAPMDQTDALATLSYCLLSVRGQTDKPTLHDITLAVVQCSPLLDITMDNNAAKIQIAAADKLVRKHRWDIGKVVLLKSAFARGSDTTTAHPRG